MVEANPNFLGFSKRSFWSIWYDQNVVFGMTKNLYLEISKSFGLDQNIVYHDFCKFPNNWYIPNRPNRVNPNEEN